MSIRKCHIILGETFLSPSLVSYKRKKKEMYARLWDLSANDNHKAQQQKVIELNAFIHNFGRLELFSKSEESPFVLEVSGLFDKEYRNIMACYGAIGNFRIVVENEKYRIKISPIIHIYPNGIISVIFSCIYVTNHNELADLHIRAIRQLRRSFYDGIPLNNMSSNKPVYNDLNSLRGYSERICSYIHMSIPEFEPDATTPKRTCYINVWQSNNLAEEDFKELCSRLMSNGDKPRMLKNSCFSIINSSEFIFIDPMLSVTYDSYTIKNSRQSYKRKESWSIYRYLEYSMIDQLIIELALRNSLAILELIYNESHFIFTKTMLKPSFYQPKVNRLYKNQIHTFDSINEYAKDIIYMFYFGQNRRMEKLDRCDKEVKAADEAMKKRYPLWKRIISLILKFAP